METPIGEAEAEFLAPTTTSKEIKMCISAQTLKWLETRIGPRETIISLLEMVLECLDQTLTNSIRKIPQNYFTQSVATMGVRQKFSPARKRKAQRLSHGKKQFTGDIHS